MLIYALDAESRIAAALAAELDTPLAPHEDRAFDDGEHKWRPLADPRGADVYVVASLYGDAHDSPHDKLCRLLMFVATLRDHGAARVTAVVPYLAYARKDRRTKPFDPLALRCVAQLFEAVGTGQLFALEVHDVAAFENAFRIPVRHLQAHRLFDAVAAALPDDLPLAVASPDPGGVKRAQLWRESLETQLARPVGFAMVDKRRSGGVVTSERLVAGDVAGARVLLLDDLIASGETLLRAAAALRGAGASEVIGYAAHGLFTGTAARLLDDRWLARIVVSDSVPPFRLGGGAALASRLQVVPAARLLAQAVRESHGAWLR